MKRSLLIVLAAAALVACQKDNMPIKTVSNGEASLSPPADSAKLLKVSLVRFVNAVNAGKDAEVALGDRSLFPGVKAGAVTEYSEVSTDLAGLKVTVPGDTTSLMLGLQDRMVLDGNRYTVFLVSEDVSKNTIRIVRDRVIPDSGKAQVRVIHAAPGAPELDVRIAGRKDNLFSGVNFTSEAGYADVEPAMVTLEVRAKDETRVLLRVPNVNLSRGTSTTVVITGSSKLHAFKFADELMPATPRA